MTACCPVSGSDGYREGRGEKDCCDSRDLPIAISLLSSAHGN